jgi:hypothetical protein
MRIAGRDDEANPAGELQVTDCVMCQHQIVEEAPNELKTFLPRRRFVRCRTPHE